MVEDISKDRAGRNPTTQHYGIEYIRNIKNNNNMIDIWREKTQIRENIHISTIQQNSNLEQTGFTYPQTQKQIQNKGTNYTKLSFSPQNDINKYS